MTEEEKEIPASGAVFTFGRSRFADNIPSHFFIRNDPIIEVDCGDEHTAVVCQNGRVFVFGSNEWGQLGLGHHSGINKPSCVKSLKPEQATHVACGRAHTIISTGSGKVFACGNNSDGQLGVGDTTDRDTPIALEGITGSVEQLSAGCHHSAALNNKGEVFIWGSNLDGQLGLGQEIKSVTSPQKLQLRENIVKIACGYYHTVFITEEGKVLVCGEGEAGKLGLGSTDSVYIPTAVTLDAWPVFIAAGGNHTLVVAVDGKVYGWGSNTIGQLGLSNTSNKQSEVPFPTLIHSLEDRVIKEVACGESHTAFVTELGELLTCGETRHGKLGCEATGPDPNFNTEPTRVPRFKPFSVTKVSCGGCHTMVIASPRIDDIDDHLSNGHLASNTLQPPEVDIVSPPIGVRGSLPPLQRVPHMNSTSSEKILCRENSSSSNNMSSDDTQPQNLPEVAVDIALIEGFDAPDIKKEEESNTSLPKSTPDTVSLSEDSHKINEEEINSIEAVKSQPTYNASKISSEAVVETCESVISKEKSPVERGAKVENKLIEKINNINKKSKMCILL